MASYSFTSLSEKLLGLYGGAAIRTVTDATRVVMVRRAIEALGDGVRYYTKHRRNPAFLQLCAETLNELKSAGLTGQQLEQLARAAGQEKLLELASIFSAYEAGLGNTSVDPADRVELSARKAQEMCIRDSGDAGGDPVRKGRAGKKPGDHPGTARLPLEG